MFDSNINTSYNSILYTNIKNSKSDNALTTCVIETERNAMSSSKNLIRCFSTSHTIDNINKASSNEDNNFIDSLQAFNSENDKITSFSSLYPRVEIVNNNQIYYKSPPSSPLQESSPSLQSFAPYNHLTPLTPLTPMTPLLQNEANYVHNNFNNNNYYYNENINHNNNNNNNNSSYVMSASVGNTKASKSFGPNYSNALSASLASTPGVTIMPLNSQTRSASNLFNYGFFDTSNEFNNTQCKFEVSIVDLLVIKLFIYISHFV